MIRLPFLFAFGMVASYAVFFALTRRGALPARADDCPYKEQYPASPAARVRQHVTPQRRAQGRALQRAVGETA
jgi:hypothetical protein